MNYIKSIYYRKNNFATTSSSTSVKRLFSEANLFLTFRRNRLTLFLNHTCFSNLIHLNKCLIDGTWIACSTLLKYKKGPFTSANIWCECFEQSLAWEQLVLMRTSHANILFSWEHPMRTFCFHENIACEHLFWWEHLMRALYKYIEHWCRHLIFYSNANELAGTSQILARTNHGVRHV